MMFGYLCEMVATIPSGIAIQVTKNELDVAPAAPTVKKEPCLTSGALTQSQEKSAADSRAALLSTTDKHLTTP